MCPLRVAYILNATSREPKASERERRKWLFLKLATYLNVVSATSGFDIALSALFYMPFDVKTDSTENNASSYCTSSYRIKRGSKSASMSSSSSFSNHIARCSSSPLKPRCRPILTSSYSMLSGYEDGVQQGTIAARRQTGSLEKCGQLLARHIESRYTSHYIVLDNSGQEQLLRLDY